MIQSVPRFEPGAGLRLASGALVALAHVGLVFALLRSAAMPDARHVDVPVDYIAVALVRASPPVPAVKPAPLPLAGLARRPGRAVLRAEEWKPPPEPVATMPETRPSAEGEQTPTPVIDMESLRAAARQLESERVPTALESLRESEQLRAGGDSDLSRAVRRAKRPDCQTRYAQGRTTVNLLLLIPLAIETVTDKGCKW